MTFFKPTPEFWHDPKDPRSGPAPLAAEPQTRTGQIFIALLDRQQQQIAALITAAGMKAEPIDYRVFINAIEAEAAALESRK